MNSTTPTPSKQRDQLLRLALLIDAVVTGANGLMYVTLSSWLSGRLGARANFLVAVGVFLLCYSLVIALVAQTEPIRVRGAWFAIGMNFVWTCGSLAAGSWMSDLTTLGRAWTILQALVVLGFGAAQLLGVRRATHG